MTKADRLIKEIQEANYIDPFEEGRQQRDAEILALIEEMLAVEVPQQVWDTCNDQEVGWDRALNELKTRISEG